MFSFSRKIAQFKTAGKKLLSTSAAPEAYSGPVQFFHWTMGGSIIAATGLVLAAQNTTDKKLKGDYMFYHKSFGVLAFILAGPRVIMRLTSAVPGPLPGASSLETIAAKAGHLALYALGIFLPVSGVVMGSYSGFGLPFFFTTIPSIEKKPPVAKQAYELHKIAGQVLEYVIPLHVAGALYHVVKGQPIMARILSIGSKSKAPKV